jgi:hypothetical protein
MPNWNLVQSTVVASTTSGPVNTLAKAFSSNVTAGNLLVVMPSAPAAAGGFTVSDTIGNTYYPIMQANVNLQIIPGAYVALSIASGANTVTVTLTNPSFPSFALLEFSCPGMLAFSLDGIAGSYATFGTPSSGVDAGPIATSNTPDLLLAAIGLSTDTTTTVTPQAMWTLGPWTSWVAGQADGVVALYALNKPPGDYYAQATLNMPANWAVIFRGVTPLLVAPLPPPAMVGTCGQLVYLHSLDSNGFHAPVTQITANPTFYRNGTLISNVQGPFWTDFTQDSSVFAYQFPAPVLATDVITYSAPFGFFATASGIAPAVTHGAATNCTGGTMIGVGEFKGLGPVPNFAPKPVMPVGYNLGWAFQGANTVIGSLDRNWIHRITWSGIHTADAFGHPTTISGPCYGQVVDIAAGPFPNLVDSRGIPQVTGVVQFVCNETNPDHPMLGAWSVLNSGVTIGPTTRVGGTMMGGVEVNAVFEATYSYPATITDYSLNLLFQVSAPTGVSYPCPWTLQYEAVYMPAPGGGAQPIEHNDPWGATAGTFQIDPYFLQWTTAANGAGPASIRGGDCILSFECVSAITQTADQRKPGDFSWTNYPGRTIAVSAIRNYNLATSPYVWYSDPYSGTTQPGGGPTGAPYAKAPPSGDISYLNFSGADSGWFALEIETTSPHGLATGSLVTWNYNGAITLTNGSAASVQLNFNGASNMPIWVTGPNTFAATWYGGPASQGGVFSNWTGLPGGIQNVVGTQTLTGASIYSAIPDSGGNPYQLMGAATTSYPGGCEAHLSLPTGGTDALWQQIMANVRDTTAVGTKKVFQIGDELWANNVNRITAFASGQLELLGLGALNVQQSIIQLQDKINRMAVTVFNQTDVNGNINRGGEIVFAHFGQWGNVGLCGADIAYMNAQGIRDDRYYVAPYLSCPSTITSNNNVTFEAAAASIYSSYPASSQYQNAYPWSLAMWAEFYSVVYIKYNVGYLVGLPNSSVGNYAGFLAQLANYTVGPTPKLCAYEAAIAPICPQVSATDGNMQARLTHDLRYHPSMHLMETTYLALNQYGGMAVTNLDVLANWMQSSGGPVPWGRVVWTGQVAGYGDGSDGKAINQFWGTSPGYVGTGQCEDYGNVSVMLQADFDWMDMTSPSPTPPAPPALVNFVDPRRAAIVQ